MNTLRSSLSAVTHAALKGKGKQVGPVVPFVACRNLGGSASTSSRPTTWASSSASPSSAAASSSSATLQPVADSVSSSERALALLKSQPSHYAVASITGRTYLVAKGDLVTVPRLKDVQVGDVLVLDKVHEIGSRDYTLRAQDTLNTRRISTAIDLAVPTTSASLDRLYGVSPAVKPQSRRLFTRLTTHQASQAPLVPLAHTWSSRLIPSGLAHIGASLPDSTVRVTAVVTENTKGALEKILKTKRRKGYKKTIQHKQPYTRLRIEQIQIQPTN